MAIQRDRDRHTNEKFFNALRNGRAEVLSKIVDAHPELLSTLDTGGRPPLLVAAGGGFTECIEMLVAKDAPLDATSLGGETAVHAAAAAGQLEAIELLLGLGCTLDAPDRSQSTPLALAAANGQGSVRIPTVHSGTRAQTFHSHYDHIPLSPFLTRSSSKKMTPTTAPPRVM